LQHETVILACDHNGSINKSPQPYRINFPSYNGECRILAHVDIGSGHRVGKYEVDTLFSFTADLGLAKKTVKKRFVPSSNPTGAT